MAKLSPNTDSYFCEGAGAIKALTDWVKEKLEKEEEKETFQDYLTGELGTEAPSLEKLSDPNNWKKDHHLTRDKQIETQLTYLPMPVIVGYLFEDEKGNYTYKTIQVEGSWDNEPTDVTED